VAKKPRVWIVADDWEALERYHFELSRRLPDFEFEEFPFGATAIGALREKAELPAALVIDLVQEDMTPAEFRSELLQLKLSQEIRIIEIGGPELARPYSYDALANLVAGVLI
jgi:hypothetical protein